MLGLILLLLQGVTSNDICVSSKTLFPAHLHIHDIPNPINLYFIVNTHEWLTPEHGDVGPKYNYTTWPVVLHM